MQLIIQCNSNSKKGAWGMSIDLRIQPQINFLHCILLLLKSLLQGAQSTSADIPTLSIKADFGAAANSLYISRSAQAECAGMQSHWWLWWQRSMWWIILFWPQPAQGVSVMLYMAKRIWPWCGHKYWRVTVHNCCDFGWCQLKLFWAMSQCILVQ